MEFLEIDISKDNAFTNSSKKIFLKAENTYVVSTTVQKIQGIPYCGYFGVVCFNQNNEEIIRRIRWLNTISEDKIKINIIFKTPKDTKYSQFIYRINEEVPFKSNCRFIVLNPDLVHYETSDSRREDYDIPEDFQLALKHELTSEEEIRLEKNLVWILGAPRSGTSWLGTQLLSYETHSINEPLIGMHLGFIFFRNIENTRTIDLFEREEDYFFSNKYRKTWTYYLRKLILNRIYAQFNTLDTKIVIKEPNGALGADIISECLPKSRLIFLIRDGRDVVDSSINSRNENSWAVKNYNVLPWPKDENQRIRELETISKIWVKTIDIMMKTYFTHDSDLKLKLKYEDLLKDTDNNLHKIYNFLEISISDSKIQEIVDEFNFEKIPENQKGIGKIARSASPGKWKMNFSEDEKSVMNTVMGPTLRKLEYVD